MGAGITTNPYKTTVGAGLFNTQSKGLVQGDVFPDAATRNAQRTGVLAEDETLPMWGSVGIYENIPGVIGDENPSFGPIMGRANSLTGSKALAGFSTFNGAYAMVSTPQSRVPLAASGGQVMSFALGSRARIVVQADSALIDLVGLPIGSQVSWDFVAQRLVPYLGTLTITSGTYNNTTGVVTLVMSAPITFDSGDAIVISSLTGTGTNLAELNDTWIAIEPTGGTTVTFIAPAGLGATTITGGSLTLGSGASSALPVKVLDIQDTNCQTVDYDAVNNFANWDFDGACAVIQI